MTRGFGYVGMSCKKSGGLLLCNDRSGAETTGSFSAHTATHSTNGSAHESQSFSTQLRNQKNSLWKPLRDYGKIVSNRVVTITYEGESLLWLLR